MLSGAPPMFVVGLLVQFAVLGIEIVLYVSDRPMYGEAYTTLMVATQLVTDVMVGVGALELARRTRGRARIATAIVAVGQLLLVVMALVMIALSVEMRMRIGMPEAMGDNLRWLWEVALSMQRWIWPVIAVAVVVGLAIAAGGRRGWVAGALALVAASVITPLPPLVRTISELVYGTAGIIAWVGVNGLHAILLISLAAKIAYNAHPPSRDHLRAARGFTSVTSSAVIHTCVGIALLVWAYAGAERFAVAAGVIDVVDLGAMVLLVRGIWLIAQAQVPTLPRYLVHVALACALATLFGFARWLVEGYGLEWEAHEPFAILPPWWIELGVQLTIGWTFVVLGRYARRRPGLGWPTVICGGLFTGFACVGVTYRDHDAIAAGCMIITGLVVIPALLAARNAIAADPVKTTADVFA